MFVGVDGGDGDGAFAIFGQKLLLHSLPDFIDHSDGAVYISFFSSHFHWNASGIIHDHSLVICMRFIYLHECVYLLLLVYVCVYPILEQ